MINARKKSSRFATRRRGRPVLLVGAIFLFSGCASVQADAPARLASLDADNLRALTTALAVAMDRPSIDLGPIDPDQPTTIAVLPPPLSSRETRNPATPTLFDLRLRNALCVARRRDAGVEYELPGVRCRAL